MKPVHLTESLGPALASLRRATGMRGYHLAARASISGAMLSAYANGHSYPTLERLDRLLLAMDASYGELEHAQATAAQADGRRPAPAQAGLGGPGRQPRLSQIALWWREEYRWDAVALAVGKARRSRRLNQADLAALIGTSSVTISAWETGRSRPRAASLSKLPPALGDAWREVEFVLPASVAGALLPSPSGAQPRLPAPLVLTLPVTLKLTRHALDLTVKEVQQGTGVSAAAVRNYEHAQISPNLPTLARLCSFYGISWTYLEAAGGFLFSQPVPPRRRRPRQQPGVEATEDARQQRPHPAVLAQVHSMEAWRIAARHLLQLQQPSEIVSANARQPPPKMSRRQRRYGGLSPNELGKRLRARRKELDLTLKLVGGRCGMQTAQVSHYESGRHSSPRPETLERLSRALEIPLEVLAPEHRFGELPLAPRVLPLAWLVHEHAAAPVDRERRKAHVQRAAARLRAAWQELVDPVRRLREPFGQANSPKPPSA